LVGRRVDVGGIDTFLYDVGSGDVPVVCLHGNPDTADLWSVLLENAESVGRVIAPDLRGWGNPPAPDSSIPASHSGGICGQTGCGCASGTPCHADVQKPFAVLPRWLNRYMSGDDSWARDLCRAVDDRGSRSYIEMFEVARPHLNRPDFEELVIEQLVADPRLVDLWESFGYDNRATPASYFDGTTVGRYDAGNLDTVVHENRMNAAADFIHRRAVEILTHGRLAKG
jgi:hypothetical protein